MKLIAKIALMRGPRNIFLCNLPLTRYLPPYEKKLNKNVQKPITPSKAKNRLFVCFCFLDKDKTLELNFFPNSSPLLTIAPVSLNKA